MQALILFTMTAVLSFHYLVTQGWIPKVFLYSLEVVAVVVAAVIALGIRNGFKYVRPVYWIVFGGLLLVMACGALANAVEPGPIFGGLRIYMRALPFFFLPAVLLIPKRHVQVQLLLLLAFCVIQLPLAWEQRMATIARGGVTGDDTFGTLMMAKGMTMFLISGACVLSAFYLRGRVPGKVYFPLLAILLVPNMLNETKGTLFLVPLGLITVYLVGAKPGARLKNSVLALAVTATFIAVFVPVYDHFMSARWDYGILDFFVMEGRLGGYLDRGAEIGEYEQNAGKLGGLRVALSVISDDPVQFAFGLGVGNVSDSALGIQFGGEYFRLYKVFLQSSLIYFVFELGMFGVVLVFLLYFLVFRDSVYVARHDEGLMGALALGWTGVVMVLLVGIAYHFPHENRALSMLFWYFSGLLMAHRMRLVLPRRALGERRTSWPNERRELGAT